MVVLKQVIGDLVMEVREVLEMEEDQPTQLVFQEAEEVGMEEVLVLEPEPGVVQDMF